MKWFLEWHPLCARGLCGVLGLGVSVVQVATMFSCRASKTVSTMSMYVVLVIASAGTSN